MFDNHTTRKLRAIMRTCHRIDKSPHTTIVGGWESRIVRIRLIKHIRTLRNILHESRL